MELLQNKGYVKRTQKDYSLSFKQQFINLCKEAHKETLGSIRNLLGVN